MQALAWPSAPEQAATAVARERLSTLLEQAQAHTRKRNLRYETVGDRYWRPPGSARERLGEAAALTVLVGILALFVIGVLDGLATVASWLH
jgi:hypothetical protein